RRRRWRARPPRGAGRAAARGRARQRFRGARGAGRAARQSAVMRLALQLGRAALGVGLALVALPAGAQQPAAWEEAAFTPRAMPDALVRPMPCGGSMVFRRIETPARDGPLEDRQLSLGSDDVETGYNEYVRTDFLVGSFTDAQRRVRYYYLGKYEVTRDQYAAVMEPTCPP